MLATAAETRAEEEKARAAAAKARFNVPAHTNRGAATQQASGNSDQGAASFSVPADLPPTPGQRPTILHGLRDLTEESFKNKIFVILKEAMNGDEDSKKELGELLMNNVRGEAMGMLLALMTSNKVALGHSAFKYASRLRKKDEHHGCSFVFVGDRGLTDPTALEMEEETVKEMGGKVVVEGIEDQSVIKEFYKDNENKNKLYIPSKSDATKDRHVAAVLPASKRTAKFVLEKKPTFFELYEYAEGLNDEDEKQALQEWALHACQTKPGDVSRRPSSILAHKFQPVLNPSAELEEMLVSRLDQTMGKAAPVATPPRQLATDASVVAERHAQDRELEMVRLMKKHLENPKTQR